MDAHPLLCDAVRSVWLRPSPMPLSVAPNAVGGSTIPVVAVGATSPLDHIQAIAQWYCQSKETFVQYHHDAPILASRVFQQGGANHQTHISTRHMQSTVLSAATPEAQQQNGNQNDRGPDDGSESIYTSATPHGSAERSENDEGGDDSTDLGRGSGGRFPSVDEQGDDYSWRNRRSMVLPREGTE